MVTRASSTVARTASASCDREAGKARREARGVSDVTRYPAAMVAELQLYEAMLWEPGEGYFLLELHLARLRRTADHFGFDLRLSEIRAQLDALAAGLRQKRKVRLVSFRNGRFELEDVAPKPSAPVRIALADAPVDSRDPFLRHKTSQRGVYDRALREHPEADDVLLWNERGELTESCTANVILDLDGVPKTPAETSGLLPGTFREHLIQKGELREEVLTLEDLALASRIRLINSVRRFFDATLIEPRG